MPRTATLEDVIIEKRGRYWEIARKDKPESSFGVKYGTKREAVHGIESGTYQVFSPLEEAQGRAHTVTANREHDEARLFGKAEAVAEGLEYAALEIRRRVGYLKEEPHLRVRRTWGSHWAIDLVGETQKHVYNVFRNTPLTELAGFADTVIRSEAKEKEALAEVKRLEEEAAG
jgi:hypothetical protein